MWAEFVSELGLKTTRRLHLVWVKGHSTKKSADALASVAEAHHAPPQAPTEAATPRRRVALTTHASVAELFFNDVLAMSEADHG